MWVEFVLIIPFNLDGLLYQYDKETSQLTNKRFEFNLYPEHAKNQAHYEQLGEVLNTMKLSGWR